MAAFKATEGEKAEYLRSLKRTVKGGKQQHLSLGIAKLKIGADFLGDYNTASALDVIFFVREIMETNFQLRSIILARLLESFKEIRSSRVCSSALWIIGEYCTTPADISAAMEVVYPFQSFQIPLANLSNIPFPKIGQDFQSRSSFQHE